MTRLPLVFVLFSLSGHGQVPATTVKSAPIFSHGVPLSLAQDSAHNVNLVARVRSSIRKRFVQVFLGIHNTGTAANLDFIPGGITLIAGNSGYFLPMTAAEVQDMAKITARHQLLGAIGIPQEPEFGDSAGSANGPNLQAYRQTADDMYDAAFEDDADNPANFSRTNLSRTAIAPGGKLEGYLYFDLGKNGADSDALRNYRLKIPVGDQVYEMDFSASANAIVAPPHPPTAIPPAAASAVSQKPQPAAAPVGNSALQVISDPDEADVALDGKFVGQTPLLIPLPAGDHTVRLTKNGYAPWEKKVHATGVRVSLDAELKASMVIRAR